MDGNDDHAVLDVRRSAELRGFTVPGGQEEQGSGAGGIRTATSNAGTLTIVESTIFGNTGVPVGSAVVINSTLSGNVAASGGSAVHGASGVASHGALIMTNSTVSGNTGAPSLYWVSMTLINTLLEGDYAETPDAVSLGNNIESPGNTCGLDQPTDQVNVTAEQLALGPLQDNGGPTETHALGAGSVAINQIPEANCVVADGAPLTTDERGEPRPAGAGFDVGAFEVQP